MIHALSHAFWDTLQTLPILLAVYLLLEFLESRRITERLAGTVEKIGPAAGALVGCIPQCGFAAAASSLYSQKFLSAGTLIAVFLSTSDEALPILLASPDGWDKVIPLLAAKLILAIGAGYLFQWTLFRKETSVPGEASIQETIDHDCCGHHSHTPGKWAVLWQAVRRTLHIGVFLLITSAVVELAVHGLGEDLLNKLLLNGSVFQPLLTALMGLIPGDFDPAVFGGESELRRGCGGAGHRGRVWVPGAGERMQRLESHRENRGVHLPGGGGRRHGPPADCGVRIWNAKTQQACLKTPG